MVFFSYSRRAGAAFVECLHTALNAAGYACWKDDHDIRDDEDWRRRILEGLIGSERTFAFLTEDALRNGSPCIDELRIAVHVNGGPVTPILLEPVTIPSWLGRNNAIDLTDWAARQDEPSWFAGIIARLRAILDDPANLVQTAELHELRDRLDPVPQEYEMPALLDGFVGRHWLRDAVERWRLGEAREKMMCVIGGPGAGKSTFSAWMAHEHRGIVVALNLCRYGSGLRTNPVPVMRTLIYLVACKLPDYRLALLKELRRADSDGRSVRDWNASDLFDRLLNATLHSLVNGRPIQERLLILVDGLDESMTGGNSSLLALLVEKVVHLPGWVAMLLTARPEPLLDTEIRDLPSVAIEEASGNADDLAVYARGWLGPERDADVERVVRAADGNMLALTVLRRGVVEGKIDLRDAVLPRGMDAILLRWMRRQFPNPAEYEQDILPVLNVLAAAGQPVPLLVLDAVRDWSDDTARERLRVLERLGSLFPLRAGALTAWHPSLLDFLSRDEATSTYRLEPCRGAAALWPHLWRKDILKAPDLFATNVLPRLAAKRTLAERVSDLHASDVRSLLDALVTGALGLERSQSWDAALLWWTMLSATASPSGAKLWMVSAVGAFKAGDIDFRRGNTGAALEAYRTSLAITERLVDQDKNNAQAQRDLSVCWERIGDMLMKQGDGLGAIKSYRASLALRELRAYGDKNNHQTQRDLSVIQERIGSILMQQGGGAQALEKYQASLEIAKRLTDRDKDNPDAQYGLSVSLEKIGNVLMRQGCGAEALQAYRASFTIRERLAKPGKDNPQAQRGLSVSYCKIGDVLSWQNHSAKAMEAYKASLVIDKALAEQDKDNAQAQRDLLASHCKIGDMLIRQGDKHFARPRYGQGRRKAERRAYWDRALEASRTGLAIAHRLAERDKDNAEAQRDLSLSTDRIGDVLMRQGDGTGALENYRASLAIRERLAEQDTENAEGQHDLSISHNKIGNVLMQQDDKAGALTAYRVGLAISKLLAEQNKENARMQRGLFVSLHNVTTTLIQTGIKAEAISMAEQLSDHAALLATQFPQDPQQDGYRRDSKDLLERARAMAESG